MSENRRSGHSDRRRSRSPDENRHSYHDEREKRPRDGSRGHKDRVRGAGKEHDRGTESSRSKQRVEKERDKDEISQTVIIKGLPSHTTEPTIYAVLAPYLPQEIRLIAERETGDCKGFAFVLFPSVEHAQFFMMAFAGSAGDPNAPQFIIGNRAVTLEYAKDEKKERDNRNDRGSRNDRSEREERGSRGDNERDHYGGGGGAGGRREEARSDPRDRDTKLKNDWLCDKCQGHNFARRAECYRCSVPRGENVTYVGSNGSLCVPDVFTDGLVGCDIPSSFLSVRGFGPFVTETSMIELFRQFAQVKSVKILRDQMTGMSKGMAYVEFFSTEHAMHTFQQTLSGQIYLDSSPLKILFAKESFRLALLSKENEALHHLSQHQSAQSSRAYVQEASSLASLNSMQTMNEPAQSTKWPNTVSYNNSQGLPKTQAIAKGISVQGPPKLKPVWPPSFDTDGGAYIFQSQSGSFLEPKSQFFYCPKSKLYYSCTNGIYYNQVVLQGEISFVRFNPPLPIEPEGTSTLSDQSAVSSTAAATAAAAAAAALIRKPVILSMGFGMKNKNSSVKINNVSKKIAGDMLKWGSAQGNEDEEEMKRTEKAQMILVAAARGKGKSANANIPIMQSDTNVEVIIEDQTINALALTSRINSTSNNIAPSIAMTGKQVTPISSSSTAPTGASEVVACLLCRRQFSTAEQLGRHERESKLHKENMMLMVAATSNDIAKQLAAFSTSTATIPSATAAPNSIPLSSQSASMNTLVPQMPTFSVPLNSIPTAMVSTLSFPPPPPPPSFSHPPSSSQILPPTTILLTSTPPNLSSSSSSSSSPHSIRNSVHQSALDSEQINFRENFRDTSGLKEVSSSSEYRDRALERREIHHQSSQSGSIHKDRERERQSDRERDGIDSKGKDRNQERSTSSFQKSEIDSKNGVIQPLDDHHNPGTQMLRKMGWNEGQGLGRSGSGSEESVGVRLAEEMNSNGGGRGGGRRVTGIGGNSGSGIPQVDYRGSGKEYKDSLMRAAKARYDQVSNQ